MFNHSLLFHDLGATLRVVNVVNLSFVIDIIMVHLSLCACACLRTRVCVCVYICVRLCECVCVWLSVQMSVTLCVIVHFRRVARIMENSTLEIQTFAVEWHNSIFLHFDLF